MQSVATHEGSGAAGTDAHRLEAVLRAMARGNQGALSQLYEQTVSQVHAIAMRLLRCKEDAEEVVCDVYAHAWQNARIYDPQRGTVMAWLAVMTRNRAVDRLRQRRDALSLDDGRQGSLAASLAGGALMGPGRGAGAVSVRYCGSPALQIAECAATSLAGVGVFSRG
jgi:hypothetical protein